MKPENKTLLITALIPVLAASITGTLAPGYWKLIPSLLAAGAILAVLASEMGAQQREDEWVHAGANRQNGTNPSSAAISRVAADALSNAMKNFNDTMSERFRAVSHKSVQHDNVRSGTVDLF